ncbi:hypothetical protein EV175_004044 [Coemansia sp. RSA 1933]|nr:hypothetical protein EV175_004044 [Coemansia sp. RSA 1933]
MRILKQRALGSGSSTAGRSTAGGSTAAAVSQNSAGCARQNNAPQTTTDILSQLQELKDKEKQVLGRTNRESQQPSTPGASGGSTNAEEVKSRQERLAREERMAKQYRDQLKSKLQDIDDSSIDLAAQKATMAHFERQLLGSSSPKELEQLELDRVNGIRSLIGLPALPPPPTVPASGSGSVRQSRPGTPLYFPSSPSHVLSSHRLSAGMQRRTNSHHHRAPSFGDNPRHHGSGLLMAARNGHSGAVNVDDEVRDMDLDLEEGELAEEGELLE